MIDTLVKHAIGIVVVISALVGYNFYVGHAVWESYELFGFFSSIAIFLLAILYNILSARLIYLLQKKIF